MIAGKANQTFSSSLICDKKFDTNTSLNRKVNVSHADFTKHNTSGTDKYPRCATSCTITIDKPKVQPPIKTKLLGNNLLHRRSSGALRPKTSLGRNNVLYPVTKKYNLS